jgi:hypothetical protein
VLRVEHAACGRRARLDTQMRAMWLASGRAMLESRGANADLNDRRTSHETLE